MLYSYLSVYPGVNSYFDMRKDSNLCSRKFIVYFTNFFKLSTWDVIPFRKYADFQCLLDYPQDETLVVGEWVAPRIEFTSLLLTSNDGESPRFERAKRDLNPDMEVVSFDGKIFPCHKCLLIGEKS